MVRVDQYHPSGRLDRELHGNPKTVERSELNAVDFKVNLTGIWREVQFLKFQPANFAGPTHLPSLQHTGTCWSCNSRIWTSYCSADWSAHCLETDPNSADWTDGPGSTFYRSGSSCLSYRPPFGLRVELGFPYLCHLTKQVTYVCEMLKKVAQINPSKKSQRNFRWINGWWWKFNPHSGALMLLKELASRLRWIEASPAPTIDRSDQYWSGLIGSELRLAHAHTPHHSWTKKLFIISHTENSVESERND